MLNFKKITGSHKDGSAKSESGAFMPATSVSPTWFDEYCRANAGNFSRVMLEKDEFHEYAGAGKVHSAILVKVQPSQEKVFLTWFFPELSSIDVEGTPDRIVTLITDGRIPKFNSVVDGEERLTVKGGLRKGCASLLGLKVIESGLDYLYPNLFDVIEQETGLSKDDLIDPDKFNPSQTGRPFRVPGLILNIVEQTSDELLRWFANEQRFMVKELFGVELKCKLSCNNGKTYIMSVAGTSGTKTKTANAVIGQQSTVVIDDDF